MGGVGLGTPKHHSPREEGARWLASFPAAAPDEFLAYLRSSLLSHSLWTQLWGNEGAEGAEAEEQNVLLRREIGKAQQRLEEGAGDPWRQISKSLTATVQ